MRVSRSVWRICKSYIDRFRAKATKAKQAQSRIKMLERMELIAPAHVDNPFHFSFRAPESLPNPLLKMEKVSAGYGDRIILESIKLNLVPGSRIGLLGRNGAGKSTLIKLLAGELEPLHGEIGLAKGIKLGYFAQHQLEFLRADESPLQHMARLAPQELEQKLARLSRRLRFPGRQSNGRDATFLRRRESAPGTGADRLAASKSAAAR
ncbi:glutathione ABC transporter ATP-binding protein [Salmonella enterica subsp. enterica serovar Daytona]|uniref:Glutathione ABC transporter ATP-binding protein n=1 Tax=Salmonella enterica subsp. enterica serovar Daytona TaxID=1962639 RepID=A0A447JB96_SALET|nr:glutathione ABC transporter ATP-binding protein [Salmonella enterica subsp. enterica serovar Daytona]